MHPYLVAEGEFFIFCFFFIYFYLGSFLKPFVLGGMQGANGKQTKNKKTQHSCHGRCPLIREPSMYACFLTNYNRRYFSIELHHHWPRSHPPTGSSYIHSCEVQDKTLSHRILSILFLFIQQELTCCFFFFLYTVSGDNIKQGGQSVCCICKA